MPDPKPIPPAVLDLLRRPWMMPDQPPTAWDFAWDEGRGRRERPSFYFVAPNDDREQVVPYTHAEAVALAKEPALSHFYRERPNGNVAIHEHATHALDDFCREVYAAWRKCEDRLQQAQGADRTEYSKG